MEMSETEEDKKVEETSTEEVPIKEVPVKKCEHKGNLETVSADIVEYSSAVEKYHNISRCKKCGEVVITDKS